MQQMLGHLYGGEEYSEREKGGQPKGAPQVLPQRSSRPRPQGRKAPRSAEFKQVKSLSARSDYNHGRSIWNRGPREYFSPFASRQ
jgi:hypothetical protein